MSRKKCRRCGGEGRFHVLPCLWANKDWIVEAGTVCSCGEPPCPDCDGTGERQRHTFVPHPRACPKSAEVAEKNLPRGLSFDRVMFDEIQGTVRDTESLEAIIEANPVKSSTLKRTMEDILAIPGVREATEEDVEKACPGHWDREAEKIAQDVDRQIVDEMITAHDLKTATEADVCVAIKCVECGKDIEDCDCECKECEGLGYIETFEDCWSDASQSHYTKDYNVECKSCNGSGRRPRVDELDKPDPWEGSGHKTTSTALHDVDEKQLRAWVKKARDNGGFYQPTGWGREFSVANMSAELARRRECKNARDVLKRSADVKSSKK